MFGYMVDWTADVQEWMRNWWKCLGEDLLGFYTWRQLVNVSVYQIIKKGQTSMQVGSGVGSSN